MGSSARPRIRFGEGRVFQLRVELEGIVPVVWRRLLVSGRASLHELHGIVERSMQRDGGGSYAFDIDGVHYADPDSAPEAGYPAGEVSLESLELHPGARFVHLVDNLGEPWRHVIALELIAPRLVGQRLPSCIAGGRAAPPDDCAGTHAYRELLAVLADPLDPRGAEVRNWLPEYFDPEYADVTAINAALAKVPKHRPAA